MFARARSRDFYHLPAVNNIFGESIILISNNVLSGNAAISIKKNLKMVHFIYSNLKSQYK